MGFSRAQSALEFLYSSALMLLIFIVAAVMFYLSQSDVDALSSFAESQRICHAIASQISAVASAGSGTEAPLVLPDALAARGYRVFVSAHNRSVAVAYGSQGTGCRMSSSNVTYGGASSFYINSSTVIRNTGGGVAIG